MTTRAPHARAPDGGPVDVLRVPCPVPGCDGADGRPCTDRGEADTTEIDTPPQK